MALISHCANIDLINRKEIMAKTNIDKFKKHQKLISDTTPSGEPAIFDGYDIHDKLLNWAILNITTKKLKELIKRS